MLILRCFVFIVNECNKEVTRQNENNEYNAERKKIVASFSVAYWNERNTIYKYVSQINPNWLLLFIGFFVSSHSKVCVESDLIHRVDQHDPSIHIGSLQMSLWVNTNNDFFSALHPAVYPSSDFDLFCISFFRCVCFVC